MILQVRMILHLRYVFCYYLCCNFVYGWVIVSLVIDSEKLSILLNIYLNAKLVIIVIQVVQSYHCFGASTSLRFVLQWFGSILR